MLFRSMKTADGYWLPLEGASYIMGTVTAFSNNLRKKIGGLYQMGSIYGFDDSLASVRSNLAGFRNVFIPHIRIDHLDSGGDGYTEEKKAIASKYMDEYNKTVNQMRDGAIPLYQFPL